MRYKKRKDGRYQAQISTGEYNAKGNPIKICIYARTEAELREKITQARYKASLGEINLDSSVTFGTYAELWLDVSKANRSIKTQSMYSDIIKNHTELLKNLKLKDIKQTHIQKQINSCAEHPRTCEQLKITIKQILDKAIIDGLITKNVCVGIEMPRHIKKEKRAFTKAEKEAIKNCQLDVKHRAFLDLLFYTGMRPCEVYALAWSDINLKTDEIKVCKSLTFKGQTPIVTYPKTNNGIRTIPIVQSLKSSLLSFRGTNISLLLFEGLNGGYMKKSSCVALWDYCYREIIKELGYNPHITAYFCRHNYATMLYYSNITLKEAVRLLGHADHSMIMRVYAHLDEEQENTKEKLKSINF